MSSGFDAVLTPSKVAVVALVGVTALVVVVLAQSLTGAHSRERGMLAQLDAATATWDAAASVVVSAASDRSLTPRQFDTLAATPRAAMRTAVQRMETIVPPSDTSAIGSALRDVVASYRDRLTAVDDLALAAAVSDSGGVSAASDRWQAAIARAKRAYAALADAGRPFLTDKEVQTLQRAGGG